MNNKSRFVAAAGAILLAAGIFLLKRDVNLGGIMFALPYVCMGLGCGAFGYGLGGMVNSRVIRNNPQLKRQLEIEQNDERNIALSNRAKAKAYDAMLYVFGALMVAFAIMGVEMPAVLLLVAAYLFAVGYFIFHLNRYNRQM